MFQALRYYNKIPMIDELTKKKGLVLGGLLYGQVDYFVLGTLPRESLMAGECGRVTCLSDNWDFEGRYTHMFL